MAYEHPDAAPGGTSPQRIEWDKPATTLEEANERIDILYRVVNELCNLGRFNGASVTQRANELLHGYSHYDDINMDG